jgi:hypothetical protein
MVRARDPVIGHCAGGRGVAAEHSLGQRYCHSEQHQAHDALDVGLQDIGPFRVEQHDRRCQEGGELGVANRGAGATLRMPHCVPFGLHGNWVAV